MRSEMRKINPSLRGEALAIEIMALNDLDPDAYMQQRWFDLVGEDRESLLAEGLPIELVLDDRNQGKISLDKLEQFFGPACGTVGCIAGWANALNGEPMCFDITTKDGGFVYLDASEPTIQTPSGPVPVYHRAVQLLELHKNSYLDDDGEFLTHDMFGGDMQREGIIARMAEEYGYDDPDEFEDKIWTRAGQIREEIRLANEALALTTVGGES